MNVLTAPAREAFLSADLDWLTATFKIVLVDELYVYDVAHENLDDIVAGRRVATTTALTAKTADDGVARADAVLLASTPVGRNVRGYWIFHDTGVEATSLLVVFVDTRPDDAPIDETTDGEARLVIPDSGGVNGIFKL